jgi:transposase
MAYLDVGPMITALRSSPDAFEFRSGSPVHIPSRHHFQFDAQREVSVGAHCRCVLLQVSTEQGIALYQAFQEWRTNHWAPIEINRDFASHFAPPSRLRSWMIDLTARLVRIASALHRAALTPRVAADEAGLFSIAADQSRN